MLFTQHYENQKIKTSILFLQLRFSKNKKIQQIKISCISNHMIHDLNMTSKILQ